MTCTAGCELGSDGLNSCNNRTAQRNRLKRALQLQTGGSNIKGRARQTAVEQSRTEQNGAGQHQNQVAFAHTACLQSSPRAPSQPAALPARSI